MNKGKFIVFEGIDGCGKTTQFTNFCDYLFKENKYNHIVITREPFKSREIRKIMSEDSNPYDKAEKCAELFINDRQEHVDSLILPGLNRDLIVLSDRYKYSTICYQSCQGLDMQNLIKKHSNMPIPHIIFIIDVPIPVVLERMKKDAERKEHKFESNTDFLEKLRQAYLKLPEILPEENIQIINGNRTVDEINTEIIEIYSKFKQI